MGRFHRHPDGTVHEHDHDHDQRDHEHRDVGDHTGYVDTGAERVAVLESILDENDRVADRNRADFARGRRHDRQPDVLAGRRQDDAAEGAPSPRSASGSGSGSWRATSPPASTPTSWAGSASPSRSSTRAPASAASATSTRPWSAPGLGRLPLDQLDILFIENVGNLVCTSSYDLGESLRVRLVVGHRGRGQAAQVPGAVQLVRRGRGQQDRPPPAPRRRPRPVRRPTSTP